MLVWSVLMLLCIVAIWLAIARLCERLAQIRTRSRDSVSGDARLPPEVALTDLPDLPDLPDDTSQL